MKFKLGVGLAIALFLILMFLPGMLGKLIGLVFSLMVWGSSGYLAGKLLQGEGYGLLGNILLGLGRRLCRLAAGDDIWDCRPGQAALHRRDSGRRAGLGGGCGCGWAARRRRWRWGVGFQILNYRGRGSRCKRVMRQTRRIVGASRCDARLSCHISGRHAVTPAYPSPGPAPKHQGGEFFWRFGATPAYPSPGPSPKHQGGEFFWRA